uniref:NADH-ubiquinone oxidoreductase chain 2 n=1 Tax=Impressosora (Neoeutrapela) sp. EUT01 TaxID=1205672 RepID=A0A0S2MNY9_9CUCU|nr:NADH deshydrogenase subunit 2 [Impressosora (Neoeutrapela) sp. EUT01]
MKIYKLIFINTMIMGTIISISAYSWFSMWMGLEINMLSIIPLLSNQKNIYSSESSMKYFIIQAIASLIVIMSAMLMLLENEFITPPMNNMKLMLMDCALLTKLGAAPFHFWFPEVMEGLSWLNCLIMLTWQKIAPFMLIMNNNINQMLINFIMISCLIISTIMVFNQVSLRKIMAYSSINHIAWMLTALNSSMSSWTFYFLIYCLMNISITISFSIFNTFYMIQLFNSMNKNKQFKMLTMMNFLSMGGMPLFIGFLPKWLVIQSMTSENLHMMAVIMIMITLIMLFIYIRISSSLMILLTNEPKINKSKFNKQITFINFFNMSSLILSTLLFNLM